MIETDKLTKYYGEVVAVRDVSFKLEKGDILGFLGPNGAGKSTTMRMLTTFLYPSSGTAVVGGYHILRQPLEVRKIVGYLPENAPLYEEMTVREFLRFAAAARQVANVSQALSRVLEQCFIADVADQPIYTLSKGYRQRVCFAQAIIHDPKILILDEPTVGLDPNQKTEVRRMIREMGEDKAILLSTHILDEAMAICNRAIIISQGEIKVDDTLENLIRRAPEHGKVRLQLQGQTEIPALQKGLQKLAAVKKVEIETDENYISVCVWPKPDCVISGPVLEWIKNKKLNLVSMHVEQGRLEDVFRKYTVTQEKA